MCAVYQPSRQLPPASRHDTRVPIDPRSALLTLVANSDCDVAEGALLIAAEDFPGLDIQPALDLLDALAAELTAQYMKSHGVVPAMAALFHDRLSLHGTGAGDPAAHYLNFVLERGAGIPLSCSLVWIGVGRRAGIDVEGIGLPGRFIVRVEGQLVDAVAGGEPVDDDAAKRLVGNTLGRELEQLDPAWLLPASPRAMLARMSRNLRGCYASLGVWNLALQSADRCVDLLPGEPLELRDRGLLRSQVGQASGALEDLRTYLEERPNAGDADSINDMITELLASLN